MCRLNPGRVGFPWKGSTGLKEKTGLCAEIITVCTVNVCGAKKIWKVLNEVLDDT